MKRKCLLIIIFLIIFMAMETIEPANANYPWPQDLGGRTIQIRTRWGAVTPFGLRDEHDFYDPDPRLQSHIETVEEMFNCKIEFVGPGSPPWDAQHLEELATSIMADEQPDYLFNSCYNLPSLVSMGLIEPLTDHLDQAYYNSLPPTFRPSREIVDFMGETYMFQAKNYTWHPHGLFWNKDMFEREGLPSLYDIYEDGDWTFETAIDLGRQLIRDTTGDGEIDQFGFAPSYGEYHYAAMTNNAEYARYEDGRWVATMDQPEWVEALEFWAEIEEAGIGGAIWEGTAGMRAHWADAMSGAYQEMEDDFGWVPFPIGPSADKQLFGADFAHMGVIPVGTEDPRAVIEVVSALWILTEPYIEKFEGITLEEWENRLWDERALMARDRESIEYWKLAERNLTKLDFLGIPRLIIAPGAVGTEGSFLNRVQDVTRRGYSPTTMLHEFNPKMQAYLDDMFDQ